MNSVQNGLIGFTCAYTPLPLIAAAGFTPHRILPLTDAPDGAGTYLHENLCPHVKKVLDRFIVSDLPPLSGVVLMNSCDTMRRLADAIAEVSPETPLITVDLPVTDDDAAISYLAAELERLQNTLQQWGGDRQDSAAVAENVNNYNKMEREIAGLFKLNAAGRLPQGRKAIETILRQSVSAPMQQTFMEIDKLTSAATAEGQKEGIPVFLFGNILPGEESFDLFEQCGVHVVGDDLCTGGRQIQNYGEPSENNALENLARSILSRSPCARTLRQHEPNRLAEWIVGGARESGAKGVIAHVMKFCDPYLARLPAIRNRLKEENLPLLVLEGDCSLRSFGQQRTRIEAFAEMLWS